MKFTSPLRRGRSRLRAAEAQKKSRAGLSQRGQRTKGRALTRVYKSGRPIVGEQATMVPYMESRPHVVDPQSGGDIAFPVPSFAEALAAGGFAGSAAPHAQGSPAADRQLRGVAIERWTSVDSAPQVRTQKARVL